MTTKLFFNNPKFTDTRFFENISFLYFKADFYHRTGQLDNFKDGFVHEIQVSMVIGNLGWSRDRVGLGWI